MGTNSKEVVIIGAGLTGLSLAYYLKKAGKNVLVIEKNKSIGGVINTKTEAGFTYETGPSTGVLGSLELVELLEELSSNCQLQTADKSAEKRYIWKKNRWHALPSGLLSAVGTPLFSWYDKFRILGEPFRPKGGYPDESLSELVVRRLGKSFLEYAVDPFLSGVYAGDPSTLITRFAMPKLYALENNYGGFVRGAIAKRKESKKYEAYSQAKKVTREVFSVAGGLKNLIEALGVEIGVENIELSCQRVSIELVDGKYQITFQNPNGQLQVFYSSTVISTVGASELPNLLPFVDASKMDHIANTTYAPVIQIAVGYTHWTGIPLDAFGGLVSSKDNRKILGVLFPSAIFPNRAPEGGALLSVFMGGMKRSEMLSLSDEQVIEILLEELKITMKVTSEPDLIRIHRYQQAIAQYDIKTEKRLNAIADIETQYPGLLIAGSLRDGIGMADRVKQAKQISDLLVK